VGDSSAVQTAEWWKLKALHANMVDRMRILINLAFRFEAPEWHVRR
jgi:hypothetical protein